MTKLTIAGALAAGVVLTTAIAASAQPDQTPPTDSQPATAMAAPTVDWPYGKLMADPASKAVLTRDLPGIVGYEHQGQIQGMTIRQIAHYPQSGIDPAKLDAIQADLTAAASAPRPAS